MTESDTTQSWHVTLAKDDATYEYEGISVWDYGNKVPGCLSLVTETGAQIFVRIEEWAVITIDPVHESQVGSLLDPGEEVDDSHEAFQDSTEWFEAYDEWPNRPSKAPWTFNGSPAYADAYEAWKAAQ